MMKFNNDALLELCRYFLPGDPTLEKEVQLSIEKPHTFLSQIRYVLKEWIKDQPIENEIPWYTFIHGLYQRGLIIELSAREIAENVANQYHQNMMLEFQTQNGETNRFFNAYHIVDTFLTLLGKYLLSTHYMLGELRLPSGVSMITMVHQQVADKCADLVRCSGYGELILYPSHSSCCDMFYMDHICQNHDKVQTLLV